MLRRHRRVEETLGQLEELDLTPRLDVFSHYVLIPHAVNAVSQSELGHSLSHENPL